MKDVGMGYIIYYPISTLLTNVHPVYEEAVEKIFENPIKIDVLAGQPDRQTTWNNFGNELESSIEIWIQPGDMIDRGIKLFAGDFFIYGNKVYEIVNLVSIENIYCQPEYERSIKIMGKLARAGQFNIQDFKDLLENNKSFSESKVQKQFVQQRGFSETEEGPTGDKRAIRERLGHDMEEIASGDGTGKIDIVGDDELSEKRNDDEKVSTNSFYDE